MFTDKTVQLPWWNDLRFDFERASVSFGGFEILAETSVSIAAHRVGIVGANGSGKSTFARLLNGLISPTCGAVLVDGLNTRTNARQVRQKVGFIFQNPDLQIVMPTVGEDVAFSLRKRDRTAESRAAAVEKVLETFNLAHLRDRDAHTLSGGEKQRLAIASALVRNPTCMVMDEPLTMLDLRSKADIAATIRALTQQVVMVTHDLDYLADFDEVLVIDKGNLVFHGSPEESISLYIKLMSSC